MMLIRYIPYSSRQSNIRLPTELHCLLWNGSCWQGREALRQVPQRPPEWRHGLLEGHSSHPSEDEPAADCQSYQQWTLRKQRVTWQHRAAVPVS